MNEQRKSVIINEIKYWQENRLLPEAYCNYLLALYTEGTEVFQVTKPTEGTEKKVPLFNVIFIVLNILLTPGIALWIHYTQPHFISTIILLVLGLILCFSLVYIGRKRYQIDSNYLLTVLCLNLLIISLVIINQWIVRSDIGLMLVFSQLFIWIIVGIKRSNKLLIGLGVFALLVSVIAFII